MRLVSPDVLFSNTSLSLSLIYTHRNESWTVSLGIHIFSFFLAGKIGRESMEEDLLPRSTINAEDIPPSVAGSSATPVLVLSTIVALCGSMSTGCAVSTHYIFKKHH